MIIRETERKPQKENHFCVYCKNILILKEEQIQGFHTTCQLEVSQYLKGPRTNYEGFGLSKVETLILQDLDVLLGEDIPVISSEEDYFILKFKCLEGIDFLSDSFFPGVDVDVYVENHTVKRLTLRGVGLSTLPESLGNLKNLEMTLGIYQHIHLERISKWKICSHLYTLVRCLLKKE